MTKAKKTLSVLLAVLMVLSTSLFSAFAVAPLPGESQYTADFVVETDKDVYAAGETATVTVKVTTNYKAATTSAVLTYNPDVFDAATPEMNKAFFGAGIDKADAQVYKAEAGRVGGFIVAKEEAEYTKKTGETVFTVVLTVKSGATATSDDIAVEYNPKELNHKGSLFCGRFDGKNVVTYGQKITAGKKSIEIQGGAAAQPELVAIPGNTGHIVENYTGSLAPDLHGQKFIYGVQPNTTTEEGLNAYFEAKNGQLEWVAPQGGTLGGTGTVCNLKQADGTVVATYTLIIFGDVNGDAVIDPTDTGIVQQKAALIASATPGVTILAADVAKDATIDPTDTGIVQQRAAFIESAINQEVGFAA